MRAIELKEDEIKAVFGQDTWTANNPFYTPTVRAALEKHVTDDSISKNGFTNQMKLTKMGRGIYRFEVDIALSYKKATREDARVYISGQWSKKTGKVAGVTAHWFKSQYERKATPLEVKKAYPSVAACYDDVLKNVCGTLAKLINQYRDDFRAYYSQPGVEHMPQKFFD